MDTIFTPIKLTIEIVRQGTMSKEKSGTNTIGHLSFNSRKDVSCDTGFLNVINIGNQIGNAILRV